MFSYFNRNEKKESNEFNVNSVTQGQRTPKKGILKISNSDSSTKISNGKGEKVVGKIDYLDDSYLLTMNTLANEAMSSDYPISGERDIQLEKKSYRREKVHLMDLIKFFHLNLSDDMMKNVRIIEKEESYELKDDDEIISVNNFQLINRSERTDMELIKNRLHKLIMENEPLIMLYDVVIGVKCKNEENLRKMENWKRIFYRKSNGEIVKGMLMRLKGNESELKSFVRFDDNPNDIVEVDGERIDLIDNHSDLIDQSKYEVNNFDHFNLSTLIHRLLRMKEKEKEYVQLSPKIFLTLKENESIYENLLRDIFTTANELNENERTIIFPSTNRRTCEEIMKFLFRQRDEIMENYLKLFFWLSSVCVRKTIEQYSINRFNIRINRFNYDTFSLNGQFVFCDRGQFIFDGRIPYFYHLFLCCGENRKNYSINEIIDDMNEIGDTWTDVRKVLEIFNFDMKEIVGIERLLAGIYHLLKLKEINGDSLENISELLEIDEKIIFNQLKQLICIDLNEKKNEEWNDFNHFSIIHLEQYLLTFAGAIFHDLVMVIQLKMNDKFNENGEMENNLLELNLIQPNFFSFIDKTDGNMNDLLSNYFNERIRDEFIQHNSLKYCREMDVEQMDNIRSIINGLESRINLEKLFDLSNKKIDDETLNIPLENDVDCLMKQSLKSLTKVLDLHKDNCNGLFYLMEEYIRSRRYEESFRSIDFINRFIIEKLIGRRNIPSNHQLIIHHMNGTEKCEYNLVKCLESYFVIYSSSLSSTNFLMRESRNESIRSLFSEILKDFPQSTITNEMESKKQLKLLKNNARRLTTMINPSQLMESNEKWKKRESDVEMTWRTCLAQSMKQFNEALYGHNLIFILPFHHLMEMENLSGILLKHFQCFQLDLIGEFIRHVPIVNLRLRKFLNNFSIIIGNVNEREMTSTEIERVNDLLKLLDINGIVRSNEIVLRLSDYEQLMRERNSCVEQLIIRCQSNCRRYLSQRRYDDRISSDCAMRIIQKNLRIFMKLNEWKWWRLFQKIHPIILVEEKTKKELNEINQMRMLEENLNELNELIKKLEKEKELMIQENIHLNNNMKQLAVELSESEEQQNILHKSLDNERKKRNESLMGMERNGESISNKSIINNNTNNNNSNSRNEEELKELKNENYQLKQKIQELNRLHSDDQINIDVMKRDLSFQQRQQQRQELQIQRLRQQLNDELKQQQQTKLMKDEQMTRLIDNEKKGNLMNENLVLENEKLKKEIQRLNEITTTTSSEQQIKNRDLHMKCDRLEKQISNQLEEINDQCQIISELEEDKLKFQMNAQRERRSMISMTNDKNQEIIDVKFLNEKKVKNLEEDLLMEMNRNEKLNNERKNVEKMLNELRMRLEKGEENEKKEKDVINRLKRQLSRYKLLLNDANDANLLEIRKHKKQQEQQQQLTSSSTQSFIPSSIHSSTPSIQKRRDLSSTSSISSGSSSSIISARHEHLKRMSNNNNNYHQSTITTTTNNNNNISNSIIDNHQLVMMDAPIRTLHMQLEERIAINTSLLKTKQRLEAELQEMQMEAEIHRNNRISTESQITLLINEKAALTEQLDNLEDGGVEFARKLSLATQRFHNEQKRRLELEMMQDDSHRINSMLEDEISSLKMKLEEQMALETTHQCADVRQRDGKIKELDGQLDLEKTKVNRFQNIIDRLRHQLTENENLIKISSDRELRAIDTQKKMQSQIRKINDDMNELSKRLFDSEQDRQLKSTLIEVLRMDITTLKEQVHNSNIRLNKLLRALRSDDEFIDTNHHVNNRSSLMMESISTDRNDDTSLDVKQSKPFSSYDSSDDVDDDIDQLSNDTNSNNISQQSNKIDSTHHSLIDEIHSTNFPHNEDMKRFDYDDEEEKTIAEKMFHS
ncbi:hypothetical protein SNEBB_009804 [Seison nebaliae]|nr:hypothetical protein SNEBB_009804 [Seison nebaliae]